MLVKVIGYPGLKTQRTIRNVEEAVGHLDFDGTVEWIDNIHEMTIMGIKHTPTVLIANKLKVEGRIPSVYEITSWIHQESEASSSGA